MSAHLCHSMEFWTSVSTASSSSRVGGPVLRSCSGYPAQFKTNKVIYRRYAGLYFSLCVDVTDNELAYLESIHLFVEILDHYFSNVCELDLVFNFHKVRLSALHHELLRLSSAFQLHCALRALHHELLRLFSAFQLQRGVLQGGIL